MGLAIAAVLVQSRSVRRRTQPTAQLLLRALLALPLMLGGTEMPAAGAAADVGSDTATHAQHHGNDGMPDQTPADVPADRLAPDCCDGTACGCGCSAPQATALQLPGAPREWANSPASTVLVKAPRASGPIGTPFRPPA